MSLEEIYAKPQFKQIFKDWLVDIFTTLLEIVEFYVESLIKYYNVKETKIKIEKKIFQNKKLQIYWIYVLIILRQWIKITRDIYSIKCCAMMDCINISYIFLKLN